MAVSTVEQQTDPVDAAVRKLRDCRAKMIKAAATLDQQPGMRDALHSLRLSLTSLDDCLGELPVTIYSRDRDTIADDRRDDLMMDADRSIL